MNRINGVLGFERAKSLIKSLIGKFPDGKTIKSLSYLPNEISELSGKNRKKLKILDCPLLCIMNDESEYCIDLEIQNYFYDGIDLNALIYASFLYNAHHKPVIILLLLIKEFGNYNNSFEIIPNENTFNVSDFKPIDDFVYVICFDLNYILYCMNNNIEPQLNGFKITSEGKAWIKLLTIEIWMNIYLPEKKRYLLPKNLSNSREIISAIMILNSSNNSDLVKKISNEENETEIMNKNNVNIFYIKIWINAFLKNMMVNEIVPFPIIEPEFLIRQCREANLDENNCNLFLDWLTNNNVIMQKNIYQEFIKKIYE